MYVCSCHAVTDGQIKESVASGTKTFRELCQTLRCSTQCGTCAPHAKEVFDEAIQERDSDDESESDGD